MGGGARPTRWTWRAGVALLPASHRGGSFRPNPTPTPDTPPIDGTEVPPTVVGRGPLPPGVNRTVLESIERELRRATGEMVYEEAPEAD